MIHRHQGIKQADVVLAMVPLGNEFSEEQKRQNFYYYDPLTTGDSSLSAGMQSIVAAEIGDEAKALEYYHYDLMMDLGDVQGNVSNGVHVGSTDAVWQGIVCGFAGVRDFDGKLSFTPRPFLIRSRYPRGGWRGAASCAGNRPRTFRVPSGVGNDPGHPGRGHSRGPVAS